MEDGHRGEIWAFCRGMVYKVKNLTPIVAAYGRGKLTVKTWSKLNTTFIVGKSNKISSWSDLWCVNRSLASRFPSLFEVSALPLGSIADHWRSNISPPTWDLHFQRDLFEWEINTLVEMLELIGCKVVTNEEDERIWLDDNHFFTYKQVYQKLEGG